MRSVLSKALFFILFLAFSIKGYSQAFDISEFKNFFKQKPFVITGGVSANALFFAGNSYGQRQPFTYYFQGNINANIYGKLNLPVSFSFTNAGFSYQYPTFPNRLSIHPRYKWVTLHIGDASMSFSPYTLNGYQFRGLGVDLTPSGPWKVSAMYGRLQKAVERDSMHPQFGSYKRMGGGFKVTFEKERYGLGVSTFFANDDANSLKYALDTLQIYPMQNVAVSYTARVKIMQGLDFNVEYANSMLTRDRRGYNLSDSLYKGGRARNYLTVIFPSNSTSAVFSAVKGNLNYMIKKSLIGLSYERIDPGYQTLGAYYFNNDLESMAVNLGQTLWKDKINIAANVGLQRDNLNHAKSADTRRWAGSINVNCNLSEKIQATAGYSTFQTYMNILPQFQYINQNNPLPNPDTLNYTQLSQNANLSFNINTKKTEAQMHMLNVNASFQDASDEQGGVVVNGNVSQFYNLATAYSILFLKQSLSVTGAYNLSYNTIGKNNFLTTGPTINMSAKFFDKKVSTGFTTSYNFSMQNGDLQNQILNIRLNATYTFLKKHNLNFSFMNQNRMFKEKASAYDITTTLGYNFNF